VKQAAAVVAAQVHSDPADHIYDEVDLGGKLGLRFPRDARDTKVMSGTEFLAELKARKAALMDTSDSSSSPDSPVGSVGDSGSEYSPAL
jgi:hypothetical protein